MSIRDRLFTINGLIFCLFHISVSGKSGARLDEIYVDEMCFSFDYITLNPYYYNSSILISEQRYDLDCEINLVTYTDFYVVISFRQYNLGTNDSLVFHDAEGTQLSVGGVGAFPKEEKSFIFKGPVTVHIKSKFVKVKKQFQCTYTAVHNLPCSSNEFQCSNDKCIPSDLVCDDHNSCGDLSDEQDCTKTYCYADEFQCTNGKCIQYRKVCDQKNDCGDSSDEKLCNPHCRVGDFQCKNKKCVTQSAICDGKDNCGDMSDEKHCYKPCYWNQFECSNRKCIPAVLKCNKRNDCGDNSDETTCGWMDDVFESEERSFSTALPIILSSVTAGIVLILLIVLSIRCCVVMRKKNNEPTKCSPSGLQQLPPTSIIGRIRESFRYHRQPTAPPIDAVSSTESVPPELQKSSSVIERIRQSFRPNRHPTAQPVNATPASDSRSENTQVPHAIYPNLPPARDFQGVDNPEFKLEL